MLRTGIISICLYFFSTISHAQSRDEIKNLMLQNEDFFTWVISAYYPLSHEQIEEYRNQLYFGNLSNNSKLNWTEEFIGRYKGHFAKATLLTNNGISWNENLVKKYKDEDWFSYRPLALNKKLYISQELFNLEKDKIDADLLTNKSDSSGHVLLNYNFIPNGYSKLKQFISLPYEKRSANYTHPPEFQKLMEEEISTVDFDLLIENGDVIDWSKYFKYSEVNWDWSKVAEINEFIKFSTFQAYENMVNELVLSKLNEEDIVELLMVFKEKNRNRLYEVANHILGGPYTDVVEFDNNRMADFGKENQQESYFPDQLLNSNIVINYHNSEPQSFVDFYKFSAATIIPAKIVSPKLKFILENFNLPPHKFYPIQLKMKSKDWGEDSRDYYVLLLDTLAQSQIEFDRIIYRKDGLLTHDTISINESEDFRMYERRLEFMPGTYPKYKGYGCTEFRIDHNYDIANVRGSGLWVSERLYYCIQTNGIIGFGRYNNNSFKVFNKPKIDLNITCEQYEIDPNKSMESALQIKYKSIKDSIETLVKNTSKEYIKNLYRNRENVSDKENEIIDFEIKNNIVLPAIYKNYLMEPESYTISSKYSEFDFYNLDRIQFTGNDGWDNYPMSIKSIGIADDGVGDYLSLFLEPGSGQHLGTKIYFLIYGGDIETMGDLRSVFKKKRK